MRTRHSKAYDLLALHAGREVGLFSQAARASGGKRSSKVAGTKRVAEDENACRVRDELWMEYERRLRDDQTYKLRDIEAWLTDRDATVAGSSVHRDRTAILAAERAVTLRAQLARRVLEAAGDGAESDVFAAGRVLAGQVIFSALNGMPIDALEELSAEPAKVVKMIEALGKLSKAHADVGLIDAKLAEIRKATKAEVASAADAAGEKGLTREDVYKILDKHMRGEAA